MFLKVKKIDFEKLLKVSNKIDEIENELMFWHISKKDYKQKIDEIISKVYKNNKDFYNSLLFQLWWELNTLNTTIPYLSDNIDINTFLVVKEIYDSFYQNLGKESKFEKAPFSKSIFIQTLSYVYLLIAKNAIETYEDNVLWISYKDIKKKLKFLKK